ncbi:MAG: peptide-methionine (R)-S-oxide reductase MsrB [Pseudomonas sp.]
MKKVIKTEDAWREQLDEVQFQVCRLKATERPFTGAYFRNTVAGTYHCVACEAALFKSETQFDAGCGWPSYYAPVNEDAVTEVPDYSHGMQRIEVVCSCCDSHLGHVFPDGPPPTGLRYCINSVCLHLVPDGD